MNDYERRQEERRERLLAAAAAADREAERRSTAATSILPDNGQPILVGHHSEKRHRRAIERSDQHMRKAVEASERAKELRYRAAGVGKGGISADDPEAVDKIRERIEKLEGQRTEAKRINAWWKKHKTLDGCPGLTADGAARITATLIAQPWIGKPFPGYWFQNTGANIRRLKARLTELDRPRVEHPPRVIGEVTIEEDAEANRILVIFPGKPPARTLELLKQRGFRWTPTRRAHTRQLTDRARCDAVLVAEWHAKVETPDAGA